MTLAQAKGNDFGEKRQRNENEKMAVAGVGRGAGPLLPGAERVAPSGALMRISTEGAKIEKAHAMA